MADNEVYQVENIIKYQINNLTKNSPIPTDDLFQAGYEGYLRAQENFDPAHGKMTLTYASAYIRKEILRAIRKELRTKSFEVYSDQIENMENQEPEKRVTNAELLNKIKNHVSTLPDREYKIVYEFYLTESPKKLKDIAEELGITKSNAHAIKKRALQKILEGLKNDR